MLYVIVVLFNPSFRSTQMDFNYNLWLLFQFEFANSTIWKELTTTVATREQKEQNDTLIK